MDNEIIPENELTELDDVEMDEYGPTIVSVIDDDGVEHTFEELDRIETEEGRFVALIPVYDEAQDILDDDGELIILSVSEEDGEVYLEPIEDDELYNEIGKIFTERLSDMFEFEDDDDNGEGDN